MVKKIALDYDQHELRLVVANSSGHRLSVTDAKVIPIAEGESVSEKLRRYIIDADLQKTETLVAIGRGKAELRELVLPPVPDDELPDMVRFQAIRSFASSSDRAIVDFLVTQRNSDGITLIAAAVPPAELDRESELCSTSDLPLERVALRPLAAAALFLKRRQAESTSVMIDLLPDDAEIVIAREGKVIFVRTVRLPENEDQRSTAIASELRRTMMACGETSTPQRIVVWGNADVHANDVAAIKETIGCDNVEAVNPFDLVDLQIDRGALPEHAGRFAPLVGLLSSNTTSPESLIDFLNPRKRPEKEPNRVGRLLMIAGPIAAVFLIGFFAFNQFRQWDRKIAALEDEVTELTPSSEAADVSIARTEQIDRFLDRDVNWLDELRRFAELAPPSEQLIVRTISAASGPRGGGTLTITGAVTESNAIDEMQTALRDETHAVVVKGTKVEESSDRYRWTFTETISISETDLRNLRYSRMEEKLFQNDESSADQSETDNASSDETEVTDPDANGGEPEGSIPKSDEPAAEIKPLADESNASESEPTESESADSGASDQSSEDAPSDPTNQPTEEVSI